MSWSQTREITEKIRIITEEDTGTGNYTIAVYSRKRKKPAKWELIDAVSTKTQSKAFVIESFIQSVIDGVRKIK